jgi:Envelope integrity protein A
VARRPIDTPSRIYRRGGGPRPFPELRRQAADRRDGARISVAGRQALGAKGVVVVPIRTGLGWRLGVNVNYLKFTQQATWNPF